MIGAMVAAALSSRAGRAALRLSLPVLAVLLFLLNLRSAGEHAGRAAERLDTLEKIHGAQRRMLDAAAVVIWPGNPFRFDYVESFNSKLRDELLNGEIFYSLAEAKIILESWRQHCHAQRPHSSLGCKPPAPPAALWPAEPRPSIMAARPTMH